MLLLLSVVAATFAVVPASVVLLLLPLFRMLSDVRHSKLRPEGRHALNVRRAGVSTLLLLRLLPLPMPPTAACFYLRTLLECVRVHDS